MPGPYLEQGSTLLRPRFRRRNRLQATVTLMEAWRGVVAWWPGYFGDAGVNNQEMLRNNPSVCGTNWGTGAGPFSMYGSKSLTTAQSAQCGADAVLDENIAHWFGGWFYKSSAPAGAGSHSCCLGWFTDKGFVHGNDGNIDIAYLGLSFVLGAWALTTWTHVTVARDRTGANAVIYAYLNGVIATSSPANAEASTTLMWNTTVSNRGAISYADIFFSNTAEHHVASPWLYNGGFGWRAPWEGIGGVSACRRELIPEIVRLSEGFRKDPLWRPGIISPEEVQKTLLKKSLWMPRSSGLLSSSQGVA